MALRSANGFFRTSSPLSISRSNAQAVARLSFRALVRSPALTENEAVRELIENGLPEPVARTRVEVHRSFSTGAFAEVTGNIHTLLHRAPRSFAEFARDYASVFR